MWPLNVSVVHMVEHTVQTALVVFALDTALESTTLSHFLYAVKC